MFHFLHLLKFYETCSLSTCETFYYYHQTLLFYIINDVENLALRSKEFRNFRKKNCAEKQQQKKKMKFMNDFPTDFMPKKIPLIIGMSKICENQVEL